MADDDTPAWAREPEPEPEPIAAPATVEAPAEDLPSWAHEKGSTNPDNAGATRSRLGVARSGLLRVGI